MVPQGYGLGVSFVSAYSIGCHWCYFCMIDHSIFFLAILVALQYENLTSDAENEAGELKRLKNFIGIDPNKPGGKWSTLGLYNSRKAIINPGGWPMKQELYKKLIDIVRPDSQAVANMLDRYGLGNGKQILASWERIWVENLKSCNAEGDCLIQLS